MSASIGSVTFAHPLKWINKPDQVVVGSTKRTRSGNLVTITGESPSQSYVEAKLLFEWESYANVSTLIGYWRAGGTYSADIENTGSTVTIRFSPENGVQNVGHELGRPVVHVHFAGEETDLYRGELNVIIET